MALSNAWQGVCAADLLPKGDGTAGDDIGINERFVRRRGHLELFWKTPQPGLASKEHCARFPSSALIRERRRRENDLNIMREHKNERVGSHRVVEGRLSVHD